jgi:hypothetical protein
MIERLIDAAPDVAATLLEEGLDDPVIRKLVDAIDAHAWSCRERLADPFAG